MNKMSSFDVLSDNEYSVAFERGRKSAFDGKLVLIDDFLYRTTNDIYNTAVKIMDNGNHDDGIQFLVKNSVLITNKRIDSFNS